MYVHRREQGAQALPLENQASRHGLFLEWRKSAKTTTCDIASKRMVEHRAQNVLREQELQPEQLGERLRGRRNGRS